MVLKARASRSAAAVRAHYDREAAGYHARFSSGLLGRLRARERAAVMELLDPRAGERVLDAGCGPGFDARPLMKRGCAVVGVDLSPGMVAAARARGVDASVADLHALELGRRFDKILCAGPLEFCASPGQVLHRLAAHLEPGGALVVLFPPPTAVGHLYRAHHFANGLAIRLYPVEVMRELLRAAGLEPDAERRPGPFTAVVRARAPRS